MADSTEGRELLNQIYARLDRADAGDTSGVLADEALDEVCELLCHAPELITEKWHIATAIGWLYWYRFRAAATKNEFDVTGTVAGFLLVPHYLRRPEEVPELVRDFLAHFAGEQLESFGWHPQYLGAHAGLI